MLQTNLSLALTPDQEQSLAICRDKWMGIFCSTEPADRPMAEAAINKIYQVIGLPTPQIIWCGSPLAVEVLRGVLADLAMPSLDAAGYDPMSRLRTDRLTSVSQDFADRIFRTIEAIRRNGPIPSIDEPGKDTWEISWDKSGWFYRANVPRSLLSKEVNKVLERKLSNEIWYKFGPTIKCVVDNALWDSVYSATTADDDRRYIQHWGGPDGQHDAAWFSIIDFCRNGLGLRDETDNLTGLIDLGQSAGKAWLCREVCFVAERYSRLKLDNRNRLHCEDGPAVAYPDGWKIYAIDGVLLPAHMIERPDELTVDVIDAEPNVEVRRIMIRRFGKERYLRDCTRGTVDDFGALWMRRPANREPVALLEVINSTAEPDGTFKEYLLRVPPEMETPHQAVAWTFGMEPSEYRPAMES